MNKHDYYGCVSDGMTLCHFGILGMHWGIRRYQPYPEGHKGGKEVGAAARHQAKLQKLKAKTELQTAKNESKSAEYRGKLEDAQSKLDVAAAKAALKNVKEHPEAVGTGQKGGQQTAIPANSKKEELKQRIIRSGDPKLIKQYGDMLNNDEYREAKNRMQMRNELQQAIKDEKFNKAKNVIDKFSSGVKSVGDAVNNVKESYNKVADVQNFLNPEKKWKKIENKKTDYAELQKKTAAANARETFRRAYGFDPYTGKRAKAIFDADGTFKRYATVEEESTGIINAGTDPSSTIIGPQPLNRRWTMR